MILCVVLRLKNIWNRAAVKRGGTRLCVGYARVSTKRQDLGAQVESLRLAGCDLVFTDKARGIDQIRAGLQAAIRRCVSGDQFVVWRLDRLARRAVLLLEAIEQLNAKQVRFRVLDGRGTHADFSQPEGRFVLAVLGSFAELERESTSSRTRHALRTKSGRPIANGQYDLPLPMSAEHITDHFRRVSSRVCRTRPAVTAYRRCEEQDAAFFKNHHQCSS